MRKKVLIVKGLAYFTLCLTCLLILLHGCKSLPGGAHEEKIKDMDLVARIRTLISEDPGLSQSTVRVFAQEGKVTLSGTVPNEDARSRLLNGVAGVKGVKSVSSDLRLQPSP